jgi:hypothetical protein
VSKSSNRNLCSRQDPDRQEYGFDALVSSATFCLVCDNNVAELERLEQEISLFRAKLLARIRGSCELAELRERAVELGADELVARVEWEFRDVPGKLDDLRRGYADQCAQLLVEIEGAV